MGIFDAVFGAVARRSDDANADETKSKKKRKATDDDNDLFASTSAFRSDEPAGAPKPIAVKRASGAASDAKRPRAGEPSMGRVKDARARTAAARPESSSDEDEADDDGSESDSDERAPKAKPTGTGYRDKDATANAEELERTVFVGNVPVSVKLKKLKAKFSAHGPVESVRMRNVPVEAEGNEPRKVKVLKGKLNAERGNATAFVVFKDAASAKKAAEALNMKEFEGRHIRVDLASKPSIVQSEVVYDQNRSVFLGQLPFSVDDEEVIRLFNKNKEYPELRKSVEAVRIVRDRKTTMGKGIGFVLFKTKEHARTALLLDGTKLGDREIRVSKASRSKAPKPGAASKARAEPKGATGAERRNPSLAADTKTSRAVNSWEGSRSRPGGKSAKSAYRGGEARPTPGGVGKPIGKKTSAKKDAKRTGKRPAVAARKAAAKAAASAGAKRK